MKSFVRLLRIPILLLILLTVIAEPAAGDDWPGWRGPNRDGICRETGLLQSWPDGGPKLLWKTKGIGEGYSGPAIVGDRLYTMGNRDGKEQVFALDVTNGGKQAWKSDVGDSSSGAVSMSNGDKEIWKSVVGDVRHGGAGYPGPRATPSVDGDRLYTLGINGDLVCMNIKDGNVLWRHDLVKDFGGQIPNWGYSESPLVDGPWVICTPGQDKATILALDKMTGKQVWAAKVGDPAAYASIVKFKVGEVPQYVTLTGKGVIAVRASDGKFLWRYDKPANGTANCTTCVTFRQTVFAASAYGTGGGLVWVRQTPEGFTAKEEYFTKKMQNHHGGLILRDGALYGANGNTLTCLDYPTGKVLWADHAPGKCSLLYADGRLYCRDEKGPISLVESTPKGFHLHGQFKQPDRSNREAWPHLVIANGRMYVRDQDLMLCYEVRK